MMTVGYIRTDAPSVGQEQAQADAIRGWVLWHRRRPAPYPGLATFVDMEGAGEAFGWVCRLIGGGMVDTLVVTDLGRLGGDEREVERLVRGWVAGGVRVVAVYDETGEGGEPIWGTGARG